MCCSFHETEEDGAERLHSAARRKLLRLQAVSTSLTHVTVTVLMEKEKKEGKKNMKWDRGQRCSALIPLRGKKQKTPQ